MIPTGQGGRRVEVVWCETGGPAIRHSEHRGFGSRLQERGVRSAGVTVRLDYRPEELVCRIALPVGSA